MSNPLFSEIVQFLTHRPHSACAGSLETFLLQCVLGKGELSLHYLLLAHLAKDPRFLVIGQYPIVGGRCTVDLLVADRATMLPIAIVELKHYSVHQPNVEFGLLSGGFSLDADRRKRSTQRLEWGGTSYTLGLADASNNIPLVQVGLLTAIHNYEHPVQFITTYVNGSNGFLDDHKAVNSIYKYNTASHLINAWLENRRDQYRFHHPFDWGPAESFRIPNGTTWNTICGQVGFLCVST